MAINLTSLTGSGSGANATSYATASITPTANRLILAAVCSSGANTLFAPTLTGNGLTWVHIAGTESGDSNSDVRVDVFRAMGASPSAGAVTIDYAGVTMSRCNWSIIETPDIDTAGTNGSGAIVQSKTAAATTGTAGTADFDAAFGDGTNNATYSAIGNRNSAEAITPEAGFTELHDVGNESQMLETMWRLGEDQTPAPTWTTSARWAQVAIEIKAAAGGTLFTISPTGSITGAGALSRLTGKALAGSSTGAGSIAKLTAKVMAGSATASGALAKLVAKLITGSVSGSGVLATVKVIVLALAGTITATGTLVKQTAKNLTGTITGTGSLVKSMFRQLAGTITAAGTITKVVAKNMAGSITPSGILATVLSAAPVLFRRLEGALGLNRQAGDTRPNRQDGGII
jgi:hypothetical protein